MKDMAEPQYATHKKRGINKFPCAIWDEKYIIYFYDDTLLYRVSRAKRFVDIMSLYRVTHRGKED
jgi:hypothetical protein